jgi:hypothetical protein
MDDSRAHINAATKRLEHWLNHTPVVEDEKHMVIWCDSEAEELQMMIRDLLGDPEADLEIEDLWVDFTPRQRVCAQQIMNDLRTVWADPYSRDTISQWAMSLSLCPMHFCDWMACFEDENEECSAIRSIFPHSHDI